MLFTSYYNYNEWNTWVLINGILVIHAKMRNGMKYKKCLNTLTSTLKLCKKIYMHNNNSVKHELHV
mgnify:FL=1